VTRLIVNADDLGYTDGVTRGILEAHVRGVVTSASLMVDAPAAQQAVRLARGAPRLAVGLHAVLDDVAPADCESELARQLARFERLTGRAPTHLDSHHHVHRDERFQPAVVAFAERTGLPLRDRDVPHCGLFYGRWDGESHPEQIGVECLLGILGSLDAGAVELGCHPGHAGGLDSSYTVEREHELRTLTDPRVRAAVAELGIELIRWDELTERAAAGRSGP
jgi:chitin disaccharide deacetylase